MAEAAGLALGVLGVAALFSTYVEAFDIILTAKDCSREYKQLSALVGLQRVRFQLWGEGVGLPSSRPKREPKIPYNTQLDLPHVQPSIVCALDEIRQLLNGVTAIDGRYGLQATSAPEEEATTLRETHIFQKRFDRLLKRIRKGRNDQSILKATRWALHDAVEFDKTVSRLTNFVDNLFKVTTELGLLQQRYEALKIHEEINAITNVADLELLAESTSKHSASSIHRSVSDAASRRLSIVVASVRDDDVDSEAGSRAHSGASTYSFYTAKTGPSQRLDAVEEEDSEDSEDEQDEILPEIPSVAPRTTLNTSLSARSCAECDEASLQCSVAELAIACVNCLEGQKECSFDLSGSSILSEPGATASSRDIPQHERLLAESMARSRAPPRALSFKAGDAHHGDRLKEINENENNLNYWIENAGSFVYQAYTSSSVVKRYFHELNTIRNAQVPFISAAPVANDIGKILASIEGPPETPYEGGIFWILVLASQKTPGGAPILRFHTKIYHPNIDPRTGVLCADFEHKWSPAKVPQSLTSHFAESTAAWSKIRRTSPEMWSLLSLLIAICGLLASPNVHDPLVPDIAQKYVEDRDDFDRIAKKWTAEYARASGRPDEASLGFPDEPSGALETDAPTEPIPEPEDPANDLEYSSSAMQEYLRSKYDEKFDDEWVPRSDYSQRPSIVSRTAGSATATVSSDASEHKSQDSTINVAVDSLLIRDAEQSHLRQMTGECFSKIEQWRMVREIRLALEKQLHRPDSSITWNLTSRYQADIRIRTLIAVSAARLYITAPSENSRRYFIALQESFRAWKVFKFLPAEDHKYSPPIPKAPVTGSTIDTSDLKTTTSTETSPTSESRDAHIDVSRLSLRSQYMPSGGEFGKFSQARAPTYSLHGSYVSYLRRSGPSPRHHTRRSSQDITQNSPPAFSPRYTSTGNYATPANMYGTQSFRSAPRYQSSRRGSYAHPPYYRDSGEQFEFVDYLIDGITYRIPTYLAQPFYNHQNPEPSYYYDSPSPPRRKRHLSGTPQQPTGAPGSAPPKKPVPAPKATEAEARRHHIPPGYSLKNWDPSEEPILLLGSVFDANSLGKWIYDWTVHHHGPATPMADMAGELWLLLIQLAGKLKRAEECMPRIRMDYNREVVEDFIESGERLTDKLKKLLKACETGMRNAAAIQPEKIGTEFVDSIFGRDRELLETEKFMSSIRLWSLRFDANCEDILRRPNQVDSEQSSLPKLVMTPVAIRTAFGLEEISELEPTTNGFGDATNAAVNTANASAQKSIEVETEGRKLNGHLRSDKFTNQSHMSHSQKQSTTAISSGEAAPLASVTSPEDDWSSFTISSKKSKKNKHKKTDSKIPDVEENISGQQPAQNDECDSSVPQKMEKHQTSAVEELAKEHYPAQKPEIKDPWSGWDFGTTKTKGKKLSDVWNDWDFGTTKKKEKKVSDAWGVWDFGAKKDIQEKEEKLSDVETGSKGHDSVTKPEQNEHLIDFGYTVSKKHKKKKKEEKKREEAAADVTLKESELMPILMSDPMVKHENQFSCDWSWSGRDIDTKEIEKKDKDTEGRSLEDVEHAIYPTVADGTNFDASTCA